MKVWLGHYHNTKRVLHGATILAIEHVMAVAVHSSPLDKFNCSAVIRMQSGKVVLNSAGTAPVKVQWLIYTHIKVVAEWLAHAIIVFINTIIYYTKL